MPGLLNSPLINCSGSRKFSNEENSPKRGMGEIRALISDLEEIPWDDLIAIPSFRSFCKTFRTYSKLGKLQRHLIFSFLYFSKEQVCMLNSNIGPLTGTFSGFKSKD